MKYLKQIILLTLFLFLTSFVIAPEEEVGSYEGTLDVSSNDGTLIIGGPSNSGTTHYCGNNILEKYLGEQCDGSNLEGKTCATLLGSSYSGSLSCTKYCSWDTSSCISTKNEGTTPQSSGGGGGSSPIRINNTNCIENWICEEWSSCKENSQTRSCTDLNNCGTTSLKPTEVRGCDEKLVSAEKAAMKEQGFASAITGAVTGLISEAGPIVSGVFIIGILGGLGFAFYKVRHH